MTGEAQARDRGSLPVPRVTNPMRDISAPPDAPSRPARPRRPAADEAFIPASDDRPLLAAHGGLLIVERLGTVPYEPTWELQDELAAQRR
jgi:hypothetical protein